MASAAAAPTRADPDALTRELEEAQARRISPLPSKDETVRLTEEEVKEMQETYAAEKATRNKRWLMSSSTDFTALADEMMEHLASERRNAAPANPVRTRFVLLPNISAPLTLLNVARFLRDGVWVPGESVREAKKAYVDVDIDGTVFRFIDRVGELGPEHWDHVCAAFLVGQAWQFKGWPFATPGDVVRRLRCFYVAVDGAEVPAEPWMQDVVVLHVGRPPH